MIYYFSGTGNSSYVAKRISKALGEHTISINEKIQNKKGTSAEQGQRLVFVVPTYAWRIPRLVEEWILMSRFAGYHEAYFIMTCGDGNGNAGKYLKKLCGKKNFEYMGCARIVMPENYIAMFTAPGAEEAKGIVKSAEPEIEMAVQAIKAGEHLPRKKITLPDRVKSGLVNKMFYPMFVHAKKFYAEDSCTGCGRCGKVCPLYNVSLKQGRPVWGKNCTHCMACICGCPKEAIEYGKKSVGQPRYQCPM